jgi:predicted dehydrogenase
MSLNAASAKKMQLAAESNKVKLVVAHYRREQPMFKKIRQLLEENIVGDVRFAKLEFFKKEQSSKELEISKNAWRLDPAIAGGGLFHDLAPHQLDLMYYFFGGINKVKGIASKQQQKYNADDIVTGSVLFNNGVLLNGLWCFSVNEKEEKDICEIQGSKGKISFSVFGEPRIEMTIEGKKENILFEPLQHVQQPMIEKVVEYFLDKGPNPCSGGEGVKVMEMMDWFRG